MPLIQLMPYLNKLPFVSNNGLVLAMDFEGGWVDLVNPSRSFGTTGPEVSISPVQKINGTSSLSQTQHPAGPAGFVYTNRSPDLTFAGDFWMEMWVYCLGQGSPLYTGGDNWLIGYGHYASTGLAGILLDDLKLAVGTPSGTSTARVVTSPVTATNNKWYHYAVGRKDGVVYLFQDGVMVASAPFTDTFGFDDRMGIGGFQDARINNACYSGVNGYMDRLRIYDRCLTTVDFTPSSEAYSA